MSSTAEQNNLELDLGNPANEEQPESRCPFIAFAEICEKIRTTPRKADKSAIIAAYLSTLRQQDLIIASRWLAGYVFPLREDRALNVSGLLVLNCLAACAGVPPSFVRDRLAVIGDVGALAIDLFNGGVSVPLVKDLTLVSVIGIMNQLSALSGIKRKSDIIVRTLRKSTALEAKYLVLIISGDLGIGVHERDIEDAISVWQDIEFTRVQSANMLLGDIGETALLISTGKIDDARMRLFTPINFMHALPLTLKDDLTRILPDQFVIEDKFDGLRTQVHIGLAGQGDDSMPGAIFEGLRIVIYSDQLRDITSDFFDLIPGFAALLSDQAGTVDAAGVIIDGVIVPIKNGEIMPFAELRSRLTSQEADGVSGTRISVGFVAFDQLFGDGRSLIQEDWYTRAANLDKIRFDMVTTFRARSTMSSHVREIDGALEIALSRGSSGIMLKNPRSCYRPGRREKDWHKIYGAPVTVWK
jgi:DNA ligase-1